MSVLTLTLAQVRSIANLAASETVYEVGLQVDGYGVIVTVEHDDQRDGRWTSKFLVGIDGGKIALPGKANEALTGP